MLVRVVGVTIAAASAVVVAAFGAVMALLFAWQPIEDEELDDDGDTDEGGDQGDDDSEDGRDDW